MVKTKTKYATHVIKSIFLLLLRFSGSSNPLQDCWFESKSGVEACLGVPGSYFVSENVERSCGVTLDAFDSIPWVSGIMEEFLTKDVGSWSNELRFNSPFRLRSLAAGSDRATFGT